MRTAHSVVVLAFLLAACGQSHMRTNDAAVPVAGTSAHEPDDAIAGASSIAGTGASGSSTDAALDAATDSSSPQPDEDVYVDDGEPDTWNDACGEPILEDPNAFIFDVDTFTAQTSNGPVGPPPSTLLESITTERLPWVGRPSACEATGCLDRASYMRMIFEGSDTTFTMLSGPSYAIGLDGRGTSAHAFAPFEDLVDAQMKLNMDLGKHRVTVAVSVMPNDRLEVQLAAMAERAPLAAAWRVQTAWWPEGGSGFWLDDPEGIAVIEKGLELGVSTFLISKGRDHAGGDSSSPFSGPRDIGPIASAYPQAQIIVLHAAFEHGVADEEVGLWPEGPYSEDDAALQAQYPLDRGVNSLIKSLRDHGVGPNQNAYVALGGVWAELMTRPEEAAHVLGKLMKYVGEDNILWGTQSALYGNPSPQIAAFHAFEISQELQDLYGYPALTPSRKAKMLGRNAERLFCFKR